MAKARRLTIKQRNKVADKLMTWANMVFAGMVIAQIFSQPFDVLVALSGTLLFALAYIFAVLFMKGGVAAK